MTKITYQFRDTTIDEIYSNPNRIKSKKRVKKSNQPMGNPLMENLSSEEEVNLEKNTELQISEFAV